MLSYWEQQTFLNYDVIIIGAGITGLSSAISILERNAKLNVLILEKSTFPSGASTKNAGFACFGSLTELLSDMDVMGKEESLALVQKRWNGLQKLRSRFTDKELGYESFGGYELLRKPQMDVLDKIDKVNKLLVPIFKEPVFSDVSSKVKDFGFNSISFTGMLFNKFEGQINTGITLNTLWKRATQLGAKLLTTSFVQNIEGQNVTVSSTEGTIVFTGQQIVICTNAFTKTLMPNVALKPGRGQVLITKPIADLKFKGTFHMEEGFYYFRNVGDRVLFGGGRQLAITQEETTEHGINPVIEKELLRLLSNELLPETEFEIDQQWSGIMAFGEVKKPVLEWINPTTFIAVRLGGMGMALGSELGEIVAEQLQNPTDKS